MRKLLFFLIIFSLIIPLASPWAAEGTREADAWVVDKVVARVGPEPVTQREIDSLLRDNPDLTRQEGLDLLIDRKLVLSWARDNGLAVSSGELEKAESSILENSSMSEETFEEFLSSRGQDRQDFENDLKEQILLRKALAAAVRTRVRLTEEELKESYEEIHPPTETISIKHILLKPDPASPESEAAAMDLASRIIEQAREGVPFESLARKHSMDEASVSKGGDLGTFRKGELLPELESAAMTLEPGQVGGPVRTRLGLHILKLKDRTISDPPPFSAVEDQLRSTLTAEKSREVQEEWLWELKDSTHIEIFSNGG